MRVLTLGDGAELFDNMRRGRAVRVAHAEVDNVLTTAPCSHFQLGRNIENIRGESIDARKASRRTLVCHKCLRYVSARNRPSDATTAVVWGKQ